MNANMKFLWYTIYNENTSSFHKYWQNKNKPLKKHYELLSFTQNLATYTLYKSIDTN